MTKRFFAIAIILLSAVGAIAQERITIPVTNPQVASQYQLQPKNLKAKSAALTLPFYDDFSVLSVYPNPQKWTDNYALVNSDYAKFPPTVGVATLDAIDEKGKVYANAGPFPFDADKLTSRPIRLDSVFAPARKAIQKSDSLYLSFYYQPQGRGLTPSKKDSLILEFHSPAEFDTIVLTSGTTIEPKWRQVWQTAGGVTADAFAAGGRQYFRQVMVPIRDSALYFKNGFQFRFRNIASLANSYEPDWQSNGDQWNIDVVWINTGRNRNDTILKDIAFAATAPSMLRNYQAMPYAQYRANFVSEMKDSLNIAIANLDNTPQNISYSYNIRKNSLDPYTTYNGGNYAIFPYLSSGYSTYQPFARPVVKSLFPIGNEEKVVFHIIHTLSSDPNPIFRTNDSISFTQVFSNYYAFDNGTAEAGIGINGSSGAYAVQFKLNKADTLRGMQIYFNQVLNATNQEYIDLAIWNDSFGKPGTLIKRISGVTPVYSNNANEFTAYWTEKPLAIDAASFPGLIFYIGWIQTSNNNLNVGLDRLNDSQAKRFINIDGSWKPSEDPANYGSLMLRPVIGPVNPVGISEQAAKIPLLLSPNPLLAGGNLRVGLPAQWSRADKDRISIRIFSASGKLVFTSQYMPEIQLNSLAPGLYLVQLSLEGEPAQANGKLIIR